MHACNKKGGPKGKSTANKRTLDIQHSNHVQNLQDKQRQIQSLQKSFQDNEQKITRWDAVKRERQLTDDELSEYIKLVDTRLDIKHQLSMMKNSFDETHYFTNTADILFQYYELVENGGFTDSKTDAQQAAGSNSILKYFSNPNVNANANNGQQSDTSSSDGGSTTSSSVKGDADTKRTLIDKYLNYTERDYVRDIVVDPSDKCHHCGSQNVTLMTQDGHIVCNECNTVEYIIIDHEKPSYRDPPKEISYFAYKRINHLLIFIHQNAVLHWYIILHTIDYVCQIIRKLNVLISAPDRLKLLKA